MHLSRRLDHVFALSSLCLVACVVRLSALPDADIQCRTDSDCPGVGVRCNTTTERCVSTEREDFSPPRLISAALSASAIGVNVDGYGSTTLSVVVDEALAPSAQVTFGEGDMRRSFSALSLAETSAAGFTYTARYSATGDEAQRTHPLDITLEDSFGNRSESPLGLSLSFDFIAPTLAAAPSPSVTLLPDPGTNPLAREVLQLTQTANASTRVLLSFAVSEDVNEPELRTAAESGVRFTLFGRSGNVWTFELDWAESDAEGLSGDYPLVVTLTDAAANRTEAVLAQPSLRLDTEAPLRPLVDAPRAIRFVRAPWGRSDSAASFSLEAEPGAFEPGAWVLVYADAAGTQELGRQRASSSGAVGGPDGTPRFALASADRETVFVRAADAAGNLSVDSATQATQVHDVMWVANAAGKIANDTLANPHSVEQVSFLAPFKQQRGFVPLDGAALGRQDGVTTQIATQGVWWQIHQTDHPPEGRVYHGMAYNPRTGETFLANGLRRDNNAGNPYPACANGIGAQFSFRRRSFEAHWNSPPLAPDSITPPPGSARLVYDGTRGVMLLLGIGGQYVFDTDTWTQECLGGSCGTQAFASLAAAPVYDSVRKRVVLLAAGNATFDWDGTRWTETCTDPGCVASRPSGSTQAVTFDDSMGELFAFGLGSDGRESWSFNGSRWRQRCVDTACHDARPPALRDTALAHDPGRGMTVLFGGRPENFYCSHAADATSPPEVERVPAVNPTWIFKDGVWREQTPQHLPGGRYGHAMTYDGLRGRVVMQGGTYCECYGFQGADAVYSDVWEWTGDDWRPRAAVSLPAYIPAAPPAAANVMMATDPVSGDPVLLSPGFADAIVRWRGGRFWQRAQAMRSHSLAPLASTTPLGAMSPAPLSLFSGIDLDNIEDANNDELIDGSRATQRYDVDQWVTLGDSATLSNRYLHAMAGDGSQLVLHGGTRWYPTGSPPPQGAHVGAMADTWSFDGAEWTQRCTAPPCSDTQPGARAGHAMSYVGVAGEVLLFGGAGSMDGAFGDTWIWSSADGGSWRRAAASPEPEGRVGHTLIYDPLHSQGVLYGGTDDPGARYVGNPVDGFRPDKAVNHIPASYSRVWTYAEGAWSPLEPLTPRLTDTPPGLRFTHGAAWANDEAGMLVFGGAESPNTHLFGLNFSSAGSAGVWLWREEPEGKPALLFKPNLVAAGPALLAHLQAIEVAWAGQASSQVDGAPSAEAAVASWDGVKWARLAAVPCGAGCARYDSRQDPLVQDNATLRRFIDDGELRVAVTPRGSRGDTGRAQATLTTDYVELRLWYRLP